MKRLFTGDICVIGRGRWGSSLLTALRARGVPVMGADPRKFSKGGRAPAWIKSEVFWLCVPDSEILAAASLVVEQVRSAGETMHGRVLLHSSGVHGSEILGTAASGGAKVGSIHPLMSFPTRRAVPLAGVPFGVEAGGTLKTRLFQLVRRLGGKPFSIQATGKVYYHAAAVMASPLLVGLAAAAEEVGRLSGLSQEQIASLLEPIMTATLANYFRRGAAKSFSGPLARGDARTVSLHLAALKSHPDLERIYKSLASFALEGLPVQNEQAFRRLLAVKPSSRPGRSRNR